jgi:mRNA-degrading endonuclease RelE of RelBE toxin-antitoxin system
MIVPTARKSVIAGIITPRAAREPQRSRAALLLRPSISREDPKSLPTFLGRGISPSRRKSRIKLMNQPFWSQYRLRVGDFRIYYDVDDDNHVVNVLRILMKTTDQTPEAPP